MSEIRKPKCPESLKDKKFNTKTRTTIQIPEYLLLSNFDQWSIESIVDDYFLFSETPLATGHTLYSEAIECLKSFVDSRECGKKSEKAFTKKFHTYLEQSISKKIFLQQYQTLERHTRLNQSINEVQEEVEITGNELVGESLRLKSQKRKLDDADEELRRSPLKVNVKSKNYSIQAPSTVMPLNSLIIEEENFTKITERVDICLGTNTTHASDTTVAEFKEMQSAHRRNKDIVSIKPAMELFKKFKDMKKESALEEVAALDCGGCKFTQFVKFSLIDFTINTMRITTIPINDERTMYVEYIVQLYKYFSNITGLLSFTWCERKDKDAATSIFFVTQEKGTTTLLDGIGRNQKNVSCIVIESSGLNATANIDHTLEDSVKNIKSATDALKNIMCKFPNSSISTLKKANVYSVQVIQTTMTMMKYSLKDKNSFKAVECCSALVPTSFEDRLYLLAVYDMFAYLYNDLMSQVEVFKALESEQLGLVEVAEEETVCFLNSSEQP